MDHATTHAVDVKVTPELIERRFTPVATALGFVFLLVVIGENLAGEGSGLDVGFAIAGWAIWVVFAAEFVLRMAVAPSTSGFLRRYWWQAIFLVLPFLRFIAAIRLARLARAGRIVGSAVRGTRTAGRLLRDRLTWLLMVHLIVVLTASQLVFEFGAAGGTYGDVLHAVALASVSGEPLGMRSGVAQLLDVALAIYAVVVFAAAAGALGAYFLERRHGEDL